MLNVFGHSRVDEGGVAELSWGLVTDLLQLDVFPLWGQWQHTARHRRRPSSCQP